MFNGDIWPLSAALFMLAVLAEVNEAYERGRKFHKLPAGRPKICFTRLTKVMPHFESASWLALIIGDKFGWGIAN